MMFSATFFFTLASTLVAAAPLEPRTESVDCPASLDSYDSYGNYLDTGCGTVIHPGNHKDLCIAGHGTCKADTPGLFLAKCESGHEWGTRFRLYLNKTKVQFMQAESNDFCIEASADRCSVHLAKCCDVPEQNWYTDGESLVLNGEDYCITAPDEGLGHDIYLEKCDGCPGQKLAMTGNLGVGGVQCLKE